MNNELKDPLEKVSNSLRRAVSINKSKETDLRTTMNTIQRECRRSFNTWSLKQEKFLRAKQNLVPAMQLDEAFQTKNVKNDDTTQTKPRERRITLVRAVAPVSLADANRSRSPADLVLPSITAHNKTDGRREKISTSGLLPPVITLANTSQFFQENKRTRRISDHRQPLTSFTTNERGYKHNLSSRMVKKTGKVDLTTAKKLLDHSNVHHQATDLETNEEKSSKQVMPGITEETGYTSHQEHSLISGNLLPDITPTDNTNQRAKEQWKKVRESLTKITGKKKKTDINKLSMIELTKLYEEIRECRYLRVGNHSRFTAEHPDHTSRTCKCLACTVKDKNKLKNHLSAPE